MNEGRHADPRSLAIPTKIANKINEIFQLFYSVGAQNFSTLSQAALNAIFDEDSVSINQIRFSFLSPRLS